MRHSDGRWVEMPDSTTAELGATVQVDICETRATMPRWPDGSIFVRDPHAAAARLEAEATGWRCWYGDSTHRFWAMPRDRWWLLVEAETPRGLAEQMTRHTSAAPSPASPVPRGRGTPTAQGEHRFP